jgi:hypothetical protein
MATNGSANGGGPPPGFDPEGVGVKMDDLRGMVEARTGGPPRVAKDDPGFQPSGNPLKNIKARAELIYRDLPLVSVQNNWGVGDVSAALASHCYGVFMASGLLVDSIIADPRVRATLDSRMSGLFGREKRFLPANDSRAAREVLDAWVESYPYLESGGVFKQMGSYANLFGFWPAQILWNEDGKYLRPRLLPFHASSSPSRRTATSRSSPATGSGCCTRRVASTAVGCGVRFARSPSRGCSGTSACGTTRAFPRCTACRS